MQKSSSFQVGLFFISTNALFAMVGVCKKREEEKNQKKKEL